MSTSSSQRKAAIPRQETEGFSLYNIGNNSKILVKTEQCFSVLILYGIPRSSSSTGTAWTIRTPINLIHYGN